MTVKRRLLATLVWTLLIFGFSALAIWYVMAHPVPGVSAEERAGQLGAGVGFLAVIGYSVIWLPYCAQIGKQRRLARQQQAEAKAKAKKKSAQPQRSPRRPS